MGIFLSTFHTIGIIYLVSYFVNKIFYFKNLFRFYLLSVLIPLIVLFFNFIDIKKLNITKISSQKLFAIPSDIGTYSYPEIFLFRDLGLKEMLLFFPKILSILFIPIFNEINFDILIILSDYLIYFALIILCIKSKVKYSDRNFTRFIIIFISITLLALALFSFNYANIIRHKLIIMFFLLILFSLDSDKISKYV